MTDRLQVRGAEDFRRLSKALKAAGHTELRKELNAALRKAAKPLIGQARAAALRELPKRGGLNALVAKSPMRVQVRTGQATGGVRVVVSRNGSGARGTNRGRLRHPVFGNRQAWVTQQVTPGWFDDTMRAGAPTVRPQLIDAMEQVAKKIVRGAR